MPPVRRLVQYRQLTEFDRGRIIGLRESGMSFREIARLVNRNASTINRTWRAWSAEGQQRRARGTGSQRRTINREDRRLRFLALRDRFSTTRQVANQWYGELGRRPVTMRTVYRRIRSFALFSFRPLQVLPLTAEHRRQRLQWSNARQNWNLEWNSVVFSDESRFCLGMHDGRQRVRRYRGERRNIQFAVERPVHNTIGIMVWGAIAHGSRSPLVFIRGNMTAARYIQEIVEPVLIPYLRTLEDPLFQQDNARPHIARVTLDHMDLFDVILLPWPPRSPDLSPIEHVWDMVGRMLTTMAQPPQTLNELQRAIQTAWDRIPQADIDNLIRSMPRRLQECIFNRGAPTHY